MNATSRGTARIGVLVPFTNTNLEADMALLRPDGISFHYARLGGYDRDEIPDEAQMAGLGASDLDEPLALLMGVRPDVVMYGCTSATLTHGPKFDSNLASKISTLSGAVTVTAAGALVSALQAVGATRIGFASPYVAKINEDAIAFLEGSGIETVHRSEVTDTLDNYGQGELTPQKVFDLGRAADHPDAQAIVLSCTDMRSVEIIDRLESELGKPVITSNQAMLFAALRHLGQAYEQGYGRLFQALTKDKA